MALISCPECNKEISDKANSCPHCGLPLKAINRFSCDSTLEFPSLPADLSLGKRQYSLSATGKFNSSENIIDKIPNGKINIFVHENGLDISTGSILMRNVLNIHKLQLIDLQEISEMELVQQDKSVIARAAVGALLFGPFGGIIGGMSGLNTVKSTNRNILIINFWEIESREPKSILIRLDHPVHNLISAIKIMFKISQ